MTTKTTRTPDPTQIPYDAWKKLIGDQLGRIEGFSAELARYEQQAVEQAGQAVDELAKLMKDSIDYAGQISAEWRKVALEASHKASEMMQRAVAS